MAKAAPKMKFLVCDWSNQLDEDPPQYIYELINKINLIFWRSLFLSGNAVP